MDGDYVCLSPTDVSASIRNPRVRQRERCCLLGARERGFAVLDSPLCFVGLAHSRVCHGDAVAPVFGIALPNFPFQSLPKSILNLTSRHHAPANSAVPPILSYSVLPHFQLIWKSHSSALLEALPGSFLGIQSFCK